MVNKQVQNDMILVLVKHKLVQMELVVVLMAGMVLVMPFEGVGMVDGLGDVTVYK